ncbi:MAG: GDP-mannose 4,6-dehydratase, partial [Methyloligellaceae bacterium]
MSNALITGGAGFIGCNYAARLLAAGHAVTIFDNLSRKGAASNLRWLQGQFGDDLNFIQGDVRDAEAVARVTAGRDAIFHLAAQVAVTSSVTNPREDFDINALGTFNVLEGARLSGTRPLVVYASTNKVYGGMEDVRVVERETRWEYADLPYGLPESQPLDFHSPYGCSKGAGDQYVRDYARIYGLNTVVMRQSCVAAGQEIVTPFGKKPIVDLRPGDLVHSGTGWTQVKRVWQTGVKPVRRLTTLNGHSVTLTKDHRVFRPHGLYSNRDFTYGDFLAVLPEERFAPCSEPIPDQVLDAESYLDAVRARTPDARCINEARRIASRLLPLQGDNLLAITEIVGRLFGDGHLGIHKRQSRTAPAYTVQHFGSELELMEVSQRLDWLGLPTSDIIRWAATSTLPSGQSIQGRTCRIQQQTIPVFTFFELLGVPVGDKVRVEYELPVWVAEGHRLVKRAF